MARLGERSWLWVDLHRTAASKALYANPPDVPEMLVWRRALRDGGLFVDVGANVGTYTIWAAEQGYIFPLLSDFWPHGEVAMAYDVFNAGGGYPNRGTFLIDKRGEVRFQRISADPFLDVDFLKAEAARVNKMVK